jgi:hypothetical protein
MSDDFDFELNLPPKVEIKQGKIDSDKEPSKSKLSLMDKLALLKKAKSPSNDELKEKIKEVNKNKIEKSIGAGKEKEIDKNIDTGKVSNLQKMLNKVKSNNDSLKKQVNIVPDNYNNKSINHIKEKFQIDINNMKSDEKINPNIDKAVSVIDTVKINENFIEDFKEGKKLKENVSINFGLNLNQSNKNEEKINKSYLNLSDSIQEIENIIEPSEQLKNKSKFINNIEMNTNEKIKNNSEIGRVLYNINLFPEKSKGKFIEQNNKINEDSLEMLITESNLNEFKLLEEKKDDLDKKENAFENKDNKYDNLKKEEMRIQEAVLCKGSFDIDTDEENEKTDKEQNKIIGNSNLKESEINKREESEKLFNNSDLINDLMNPNKNNEINLFTNWKNPFAQRDSNLNESKKMDDFNISQNLVNLSNDIQEYKSSNDITKLNNNVHMSKDIKSIKNDIGLITVNKEIKENDLKNRLNVEERKSNFLIKNDNLINKDSLVNIKENALISYKKLNDSLFEKKNTLDNYDKGIENNILKEINEVEDQENLIVEEKNIKDIFKLIEDDDEDDSISQEHILKESLKTYNKNYLNNHVVPNESIFNKNINHAEKSFEDKDLKLDKINEQQMNNNKKNSILDVDDIPEIEENNEEDLNIINLDKKVDKNNLFNKPDTCLFNMKNNKNDSLGIFHNERDKALKSEEKVIPSIKTQIIVAEEKKKKVEIVHNKNNINAEQQELSINEKGI